ncbi:lactate utilization protein A [Variibacter gotjawalensis]|uniref:Glycolate oxidase iron-sulfur subunit n=1 Tax=Variibacter gotjawalensis TaxID=1333996 RepID=A0A0S3PRE2_9BRAD|nr:heterodisulfide reductase-related iron-sulfur binding cluster [Variibacter gotjawalensis]NIK48750.1 glycolate oxidase iron-sulfur subunit [Variibacter gotjawalensis]RZS50611.1 glycolate oxidase iron-sulfur subunit [Variibacter gotjawalensis]BAT58445.1 lactate utilization protein A [Variibacter gotjawalensis]
MQTHFSLAQLADPNVAEADKILRACVHCGFCTATCPTYVLLGDELDSPRGRIYLIKDMLENGRPAGDEEVKHIDRCLSCLACMTTCPSGVHYMHLVDHARAHIEETYKRPWRDRIVRDMLAMTLPYRGRFRAMVALGWLAGRGFKLASLIPWRHRVKTAIARKVVPTALGWSGLFQRMVAMVGLSPDVLPNRSPYEGPATFAPEGEKRARVAVMMGCANEVLAPQINAAAIRLLVRNGVEVVLAEGEGCCGALVHHMGREAQSHAQAKQNIDAWTREIERGGLDAILITASGCGTTVKDYGYMFRNDAAYAEKAARVAKLTKDISEYLVALKIEPATPASDIVVAYHAACSLQHGQRVLTPPKQLLKDAGFTVREAAESHLCCGSAGTYNMLQPEISRVLRDRKVANIERTSPDIIATGNIGCMFQIAQGTDVPIVHTVELLDWANGGPTPDALIKFENRAKVSPLTNGVLH